jgi:hypothetical protein
MSGSGPTVAGDQSKIKLWRHRHGIDPETLIVLQEAFDAAWAAVPEDCRSETRKSELTQVILNLAAEAPEAQAGVELVPWLIPAGRSESIDTGRAIRRQVVANGNWLNNLACQPRAIGSVAMRAGVRTVGQAIGFAAVARGMCDRRWRPLQQAITPVRAAGVALSAIPR